MSKRKYTHIKEFEPKLLAMCKAGYTQQKIVPIFGMEKSRSKVIVKSPSGK